MKRHFWSAILLPLLVSPTVQAAMDEASKEFRLICTYSYTINDKGEKSDTTGEDLFTVLPSKAEQVAVRKQGLSSPFVGTISEEEIVAKANYEIQNIKFAESLVINRFTGKFQISFGMVGKGGLIHFGTCRTATKQIF